MLTILDLPIHQLGMTFHLFRSSLISFNDVFCSLELLLNVFLSILLFLIVNGMFFNLTYKLFIASI